ncbi:DUF3953 domain-containing protein [Neobacillus endophyticus]|uniref:DUF3953 domain-containing protein n=1 Tax=Neobacillus endophyticus TaxID=2738405 RepID=UPI001C254B1A|nr:DUF3953 domain-containing protein [Neobacillus endophyticus]
MIFSIYGLIVNNQEVLPINLFLLGIIMFSFGISELQQRKRTGTFYMLVSALLFYGVLKTALLHVH